MHKGPHCSNKTQFSSTEINHFYAALNDARINNLNGFNDVRRALERNPQIVFERSREGDTSLIIVLIKYEHENKINSSLFKLILSAIKENSDLNAIHTILTHPSKAGFMPLQSALKSGNPEITNRLFDILEKHPKILAENLSNITKDGFMPLQSALKSGKPEITNGLFDILEKHPKILAENLSNITKDGFMPLQSALKSGNPEITNRLFDILEKHPKTLAENLSNITKDGFTSLEQALRSGNLEITNRLLDILENHPGILVKNLLNLKKDGFMPLQHALRSGNLEITNRLLDILEMHPEILIANLRNSTKDGFMSLQHALASSNPLIVNRLLEVLEKNPKALAENLHNRTKNGFMSLQHALASKNFEVTDRLLKILSKHKEALIANLRNRTKDGFMLLQQALASNSSPEMVYTLIELLRHEPKSLRDNLLNITERNHSTFSTAARNGQHQIIQLYLWAFKLAFNDDAKIEFKKIYSSNRAPFLQWCQELIDKALRGDFPDAPQLAQQAEKEKQKKIYEIDEKGEGEITEKNSSASNNYNEGLDNLSPKDTQKITEFFERLPSASNNSHDFDWVQKMINRNPEIVFARNRNRDTSLLTVLLTKGKHNKHKDQLVDLIISIIEKSSNTDSIYQLLTHSSNAGFMPLQHGLASSTPLIANRLLEVLEKHPKALADNLHNRTKDGFMLLQGALASKNFEVTDRLLKILSKDEEALIANLRNRTKDGFMSLQHALSSSNPLVVNRLLKVLEKHPKALADNLHNGTNHGFMSLQHALASKNFEVTDRLLKILSKDEEALIANLRNITKDGFMPLQQALASSNPLIVNRLLEILEKHPKAFANNLQNRTKDGFMPLQQALASSNPLIVNRLLEVLKNHPKAFADNLSNVTKDGSMPLQSALKSGNLEITNRLLDILENHPEILTANLCKRTKYGFMPLQHPFASKNIEVTDRLLKILSKHKEALLANLRNRSKDGFMPLQQAFASNWSSEMVYKLIELLRHEPKLLRDNLLNITERNHSTFSTAARNGQHEIIQLYLWAFKLAFNDDAKIEFKKIYRSNRAPFLDECQELINKALRGDFPDAPQLAQQAEKEKQKKIYEIDEKGEGEITEKDNSASNSCLDNLSPKDTQQITELFEHLRDSLSSKFPESIELESKNNEHEIAEDGIIDAFLPKEAKGKEKVTITEENNAPLNSNSKHHAASMLLKELPASKRIKSIESVLSKELTQARPTNTIYDKSREAEEEEVVIVPPTAGINPKYLDHDYQQSLDKGFHPGYHDRKPHKLNFSFIHQLPPLSSKDNRKPFEIRTPNLKATFYTCSNNIVPKDEVTFICAGRKQNALIPLGSRCIVVCTQSEFEELKRYGIRNLLMVKEVYGQGGVFPTDKITSRRLAILLAANYWQLNNCIMLDDNIQCVEFVGNGNDWLSFYRLLEHNLGSEPCLTVSKHYSNQMQPGQLGSKLFMLNMARIKEQFPQERDLTVLLPYLKNVHFWGEDYYFQLMLHYAFKPHAQGYRILDKTIATFTRAITHRNAFALSGNNQTRILANTFDTPLFPQHNGMQESWVRQTIICLNQIIDSNRQNYISKKALPPLLLSQSTEIVTANAATNMQVSQSKSIMNRFEIRFKKKSHLSSETTTTLTRNLPKHPTNNYDNKEPLIYRDVTKELKNEIDNMPTRLLRHCQMKALRSIAKHCVINTQLQVIMATGTGKTRVQGMLATLMYSHLQENEHIVISTANIQLVSQFAQALKQAYPQVADNIVCISSDPHHISVNKGLAQGIFYGKPKLFIFCIDSLLNLIEQNPSFTSQARLMLCDEYHAYAVDTIKIANMTKNMMIGFSATPPKSSTLKTVYTYSIKQAIKQNVLAPLIIDSLEIEYNLSNVEAFERCLPTILKQQYHPGFTQNLRNLSECKGVIYLPSIKAIERTKKLLDKHSISSYAIHSQNSSCFQELEKFKCSQHGVLLACDMCKIGFDDENLSYVIIAQKPGSRNAEQIVGRALRKNGDKIGYVLTFSDVAEKLQRFIKGQMIKFPIFSDYLENKTNAVARSNEENGHAIRFSITPFMQHKQNEINVKKSLQLSDEETQKMLTFLRSQASSRRLKSEPSWDTLDKDSKTFFDQLESKGFFNYAMETVKRNERIVRENTAGLKRKTMR
ncbi:DEAD/DEAH box helicase family protein [Candidatus Berkiella aquae]|uniref:Ankyrin repeats (3 copies) n=1 Tax=Candidatus Berkiella aquae TaxID=295108 RepID=A0A0Q9YK69_9GAMM|nr:DEAD/DEAH box helicase family protein [Candidatus Berkiella aquae]MCS5711247.1 DEAD/DEAH box helicase family protein [Candidatus Berkiella aquae]